MRGYDLVAAGLLAAGVSASAFGKRDECPDVHIVTSGGGAVGYTVNRLLELRPGGTTEDIAVGTSVGAGTSAFAAAVNGFYSRCPSTKLVFIGYSDVGGSRIVKDAY